MMEPPRGRPFTPAPLPGPAAGELGDLRSRLRRPILLLAAGIAITIIDMLVTNVTGEALMIGPLRPTWFAIPLALAGVGLACWRVLGHRDD
jgi:hypothetical protein